MARLRFTERARQDIIDIGNFIRADRPAAARDFIDRLQGLCTLLASRPLIGRRRDEFGVGLRSMPFGRYIIFYVALEDGAEIARVVHGARDLRRAFRTV
jgi:toxin ParE1/3/4